MCLTSNPKQTSHGNNGGYTWGDTFAYRIHLDPEQTHPLLKKDAIYLSKNRAKPTKSTRML